MENTLATKKFMDQSLNRKYILGIKQGNPSLYSQHRFNRVFHKQERVLAEKTAGSGEWEPARIKSHDDYFTEYLVNFESGTKATLAPEQIRPK